MPVDRTTRLSISQFSELLGVDPERFVGIEVDRPHSLVTVVQEPKARRMAPPLSVEEQWAVQRVKADRERLLRYEAGQIAAVLEPEERCDHCGLTWSEPNNRCMGHER